jgi:hypothetical protein
LVNATTNQKLVAAKKERWGRLHAGLIQRGGTLSHCLGGRIEQPKNKNREKDRALSLDGCHWRRRHNNQPKVGLNNRI